MYEWSFFDEYSIQQGNALLIVFTDLFGNHWEPLMRLVNTDEEKGTSLVQWPKMWQPVCATV